MGMQNGSKLEIYAFKLKLHPLVVFSHVCKPYVWRPRATWKTGNTRHADAHIMSTTFIQFTKNSTVGSMLALYGSIMHVATL